MMAGIEIPMDAADVAAPGASDPQVGEGPGLEDEPSPSAKCATVALYYAAKVWNEQMVRQAVDRWITAAEAGQILNDANDTKGV